MCLTLPLRNTASSPAALSPTSNTKPPPPRPPPTSTPARTPSASAPPPRRPPQDIANAAQFPASNFATLTSGESLVVDGEMPIEPPTPIATRLTGLEV